MDYNMMRNDSSQQYASTTLNEFLQRTYAWMSAGLLLTFAIAFLFFKTNLLYTILMSMPALPFLILIAELIIAFTLSSKITSMSINTAKGLFFGYATLNGVMFSAYFYLFEMSSLIFVFLITALFFGVMAVYGHTTKTDLSTLRPLLIIGLICLAVFWLFSLFFDLSSMERFMCVIGVGIFMLLTAFDQQKLKAVYESVGTDEVASAKMSVYGALTLYLDFINLFIYLLRLFGKRRN